MMTGRRPRIDPDIILDNVRSNIIRGLIENVDSYYAGDDYLFCDIQNRFVAGLTDDCCCYQSNGYGIRVPVLKFFYVVPHCRGRGVQRMFLDYITSVADDVGESIAGFADAFEMDDLPRLGRAVEYMAAILQNEDAPMDDWVYQTAKQRRRMMDVGFKNVRYEDGENTQAWQQLYYCNAKACEKEKMIVDNLTLHYEINWARLGQAQKPD